MDLLGVEPLQVVALQVDHRERLLEGVLFVLLLHVLILLGQPVAARRDLAARGILRALWGLKNRL